jgi:hypothetical protein
MMNFINNDDVDYANIVVMVVVLVVNNNNNNNNNTYLHYSICKELGIETGENWYSRISKPVTEHEGITVLWNQGIQTDREVSANWPDIIVKNK